jgi:hypothetical protein
MAEAAVFCGKENGVPGKRGEIAW